jgi:hypothetical protein
MAVLTMRSDRQPVATRGNRFGLISPSSAPPPLATNCHRLQPPGSIKAPYFVVRSDYARPETCCGRRSAGSTRRDTGRPEARD